METDAREHMGRRHADLGMRAKQALAAATDLEGVELGGAELEGVHLVELSIQDGYWELNGPDRWMRSVRTSLFGSWQTGNWMGTDINGRDIALGEMVELAPNKRVVFTFGWEKGGDALPPGSSTVEIALVEDGDGTIVRLSHRGLTAEQAAGHKEGWEHFLPRLVALAEGRDPGHDPWTE